MTNRIRKVYRSPTFWLAVCVAALLYAMWQDQKERPVVVRDAQVEFCQTVSQPAIAAGIERDRDIAIFAQAAANARRAEGQIKTAMIYEGVVKRSAKRRDESEERLAVPCSVRFPKP